MWTADLFESTSYDGQVQLVTGGPLAGVHRVVLLLHVGLLLGTPTQAPVLTLRGIRWPWLHDPVPR